MVPDKIGLRIFLPQSAQSKTNKGNFSQAVPGIVLATA